MSLRAWISLRIGKGMEGLKKRGDVLCVKLPDSPVGVREWNEFLIVDALADKTDVLDKEKPVATK